MGYDAYTYAVIGVEIENSEQQLYRDSKTKAFDHSFGPEVNFDPKTGKKLWIAYKTNIFDGGEEAPDSILPGIGFVHENCERRGSAYIGLVVGGYRREDSFAEITGELLAATQQKVAQIVAEYKLDAGPFGLHAVKYESY